MNEEMITMEKIENEAVEAEQTIEVTETSSGSGLGKALLIVGTVVTAGAVLWHKTKDKREARQIKKLEKKGYVICHSDDVVEAEESDVDGDTENEEN